VREKLSIGNIWESLEEGLRRHQLDHPQVERLRDHPRRLGHQDDLRQRPHPEFHLDTPNIPMLAEGGIVNSPHPGHDRGSGPEAVVPLNGRYGATGGGDTHVHIHLNGVYGGTSNAHAPSRRRPDRRRWRPHPPHSVADMGALPTTKVEIKYYGWQDAAEDLVGEAGITIDRGRNSQFER